MDPDFQATHARWIKRVARDMDSPDYREKWRSQQCFSCIFFVALAQRFSDDWGVCANAKSTFDGTVKFEHDGCDEYRVSAAYA